MNGAPTYADAVQRLNSLQSGFATLRERRLLGHRVDGSAMRDMECWVRALGYAPKDFDRLNIIHVAGTKGKGSTCAYIDSILSCYKHSVGLPKKTGLYTSPHLIAVRERIRINSVPISEKSFAKYFFQVWNALEKMPADSPTSRKYPSYFRFLTLLSFHVFMSEEVDMAIYEVGVGGEWDSTNVIEKPLAAAITTLGIDHTKTLGDTIEKIAWHKGGIFKRGCPALSVEQLPNAMRVLQQRAKEKDIDVSIVKNHAALRNIQITPAEQYQMSNASLAIALSAIALRKFALPITMDDGRVPDQFVDGLQKAVWRGRFEMKVACNARWYVDGAHTVKSLEAAAKWFTETASPTSASRILIFNHQSQRDAGLLLRSLHHSLCIEQRIEFDEAIFCTDVTYKDLTYKLDFMNLNSDLKAIKELSVQHGFADIWQSLESNTKISVLPTIEDAVEHVAQRRLLNSETQVFVTGDLHLVGGVLSFLDESET